MPAKINKAYWRRAGHRLRVARLALGISEQEAADACGVTLRTYRKYEVDGLYASKALIDYVTKYDVSFDWIVRGEGNLLKSHLTKNAVGKIAILPVMGPEHRRLYARIG